MKFKKQSLGSLAHEELTDQEVVDLAIGHLIAQGTRSVNKHGACMYKGLNGTCCAAAPFIQLERYTPGVEGNSISGAEKQYSVLENNTESRVALLGALQHLHDRVLSPALDDIRIRTRSRLRASLMALFGEFDVTVEHLVEPLYVAFSSQD